jgi:hypothetical protein
MESLTDPMLVIGAIAAYNLHHLVKGAFEAMK